MKSESNVNIAFKLCLFFVVLVDAHFHIQFYCDRQVIVNKNCGSHTLSNKPFNVTCKLALTLLFLILHLV